MSRPGRFAFLAAITGAQFGCQATRATDGDAAGVTSNVALFQVSSSDVPPNSGEDEMTRGIVAACRAEDVTDRALTAFKTACGESHTSAVQRPFDVADYDLSYAWVLGTKPDFAVAVAIKPLAQTKTSRSGSGILSIIGWFTLGIPGFVLDDYDYSLPVEIEARIWDRRDSERQIFTPKAKVATGSETFSTDFVDRNRFISVPYVLTILIPPHVVSAFDGDDVGETARVLLDQALGRVAREAATKIRELESKAPKAAMGG